MAALGGILAAAILKVVGDQIGHALGGQIKLQKNFEKDLKKMKMALESVEAVLEEAERRSITDKPTLLWLKRLTDTMYAISDMIDEFEADTQPSARKLSFKKYLDIMIPCLTIGSKIKMANMMETVMGDLDVVTDQYKKFKFGKDTNASEPKITDIRETTSIMETQIVGRTTEKEEILASLSESMQKDITILPICGLGGLGKTTLAKMVYNSSQFEEYSHVWVYASQTLNLMNTGNSIISQLSKEKKESGYTIMQMMQNSLQELLDDKKILIVLDDLWESDVDKLKCLTDMLKIGKGSNVVFIVTTRSEDIANKICTMQPYKLAPLTDGMCWSIIKQKSAFESRGDKEQLEEIGKAIALKCCGVALAASSLGHTLQSMKLSEWESVRDSNIWTASSSIYTTYSQVLASLKLSYSVIPSYLKLCFAYCAIFPKGHRIVKNDLIDQWVSLGFSTWQLGESYINQLLGLSFLEHSKSPSAIELHGEDITFLTMHDLVHDLARSVVGEEILVVGEGTDVTGSYYHYALLNDCSRSLFSELSKIRALRFMECGQIELHAIAFSSAKSLRVLDLSECSIHKLPDSIGTLKQLRYLNAPRIQHEILPESITRLTKLIYLNLHGSHAMVALPKSIGDIEGLVYLNLSGCSGIKKLPRSFGRLKELVHLDFSNCSRVRGISKFLGRFNQLKYLNLSGCDMADRLDEALVGLTQLKYLNLSGCDMAEHRDEVLVGNLIETNFKSLPDDLTNLCYLNLSHIRNTTEYGFDRLINHICSNFSNLVHLDLSNNLNIRVIHESICGLTKLHTLDLSECHKLQEIPESMGKLDNLKFLILNGCSILSNLHHLSSNVVSLPHFVVRPGYGDSGSNLVQLQSTDPVELQISKLENVKSVAEGHCIKLMEKQSLVKLTLKWTRAVKRFVDDKILLEKLVPPSTLKKLEICGYNGVSFPSWVVGQLPNLDSLVLRDMANLVEWSTSYSYGEEHVIDTLEIHDCPMVRMKPLPLKAKLWIISNSDNVLSSWEEEGTMSHVSWTLDVARCKVPMHQWRLLQQFSGLTDLSIKNCCDLTSSPEITRHLSYVKALSLKNMEELPVWIGELTSLEHLKIVEWRGSEWNQNLRQLTKLQSLVFSCCHSIASLGNWLGELTSLEVLYIQYCDVLRSLPRSIKQLTNLKNLNIKSCDELKYFVEPEERTVKLTDNHEGECILPTSLEELVISCCSGIKSLPEGIQQLTNLKNLRINSCPELKYWVEPEERTVKLTDNHEGECILPTSLQALVIIDCEGIKSLPEGIQQLTNLRTLEVLGCTELLQWCEAEENKTKLAHIIEQDIWY